MRTKTLLLAAVLSAAGAATSLAQAVYSVNAVGYINLAIPKGFSIIANQLDAGTGNNTVGKLLTGVDDGTIIYKWNGTTFETRTFDSLFGGWTPDGNLTLLPGEAAFISSPTAKTVTLVGEVPQGNLSNPVALVKSKFAMTASQVPQQAGVTAVLKFPAADGDVIYTFDKDANTDGVFDGYNVYTFDSLFGGWQPSEPSPKVGQGFWVLASADKSWTRVFSVNTP